MNQLKEHSTHECKEALGKGHFSCIGKRRTNNSSKAVQSSRIGKDFQAVLPNFGEKSEDRKDGLIVYDLSLKCS